MCRHAGLDPDRYSPKTLRHTYATLNLHDGVDVYYVSQQLGPRGANQEF